MTLRPPKRSKTAIIRKQGANTKFPSRRGISEYDVGLTLFQKIGKKIKRSKNSILQKFPNPLGLKQTDCLAEVVFFVQAGDDGLHKFINKFVGKLPSPWGLVLRKAAALLVEAADNGPLTSSWKIPLEDFGSG